MKKLIIIFLLFPMLSFAKEKIIINEETLKKLVTENVPSIEKINTMIVQSALERTKYNQKYAPFINGEASYSNVDGKMYKNYNGNYESPAKRIGISVNQNLPVGISFDAGIYDGFAKNYSYFPGFPSVYSQYDSGLEAKFTIDLWQNLLGYSERAERLGFEINEQEKMEQAKIETIKFYTEIRKMYWNLSVNNNLIRIYESLIKQAVIQEDNIKKMYKSSIADKGDLARATAAVNVRKADLLSIEYNIKQTKQKLSNLIPELNDKELIFEFKNYEISENKIKSCYSKIKQQKEIPFDLSSYTRLIKYKDEKIKTNLKSLERYSGPDVKFEAKAASLGFGNENSDSLTDMSKFERRDYSIGVNVSMPFGSTYSNTKENQMKILKMQYNYEKKEIISNMTSFHNYFSESVFNLFEVREQQKEYRDNLNIRVKSMRKKYNQGRISLSELIQDEDSLFESEVALIQTNYNIISLLIDYFSIFNDTDCDFNIKI